jgi:hypothetical protein
VTIYVFDANNPLSMFIEIKQAGMIADTESELHQMASRLGISSRHAVNTKMHGLRDAYVIKTAPRAP